MTIILLSVTIFVIMFIAMSIGVLLGRVPIKGSCGGLASQCGSCSRPCKNKKELV